MARHEYQVFEDIVLAIFDASEIEDTGKIKRATKEEAKVFLDGIRHACQKIGERDWALVVDFGGVDYFASAAIPVFEDFLRDPTSGLHLVAAIVVNPSTYLIKSTLSNLEGAGIFYRPLRRQNGYETALAEARRILV